MPVKRPAFSFAPRLKSGQGAWQMSLLLAASVLLTGLLAVPRPAAITELPLPSVNWRRVAADRATAADMLSRIADQPLAYELRSVGELFRRFGVAEAGANASEMRELSRELAWAAQDILQDSGPKGLSQLLLLQTHLFIQAARFWQPDTPPPSELIELGGSFTERVENSPWLGRHVEDVEAALRMMFQIRWLKLTRLGQVPELEPSVDDFRLYYAFRLRNPEGESERARLEAQLRYVEGLSRFDVAYPHHYAAGILHFRLGAFGPAYESFSAHLRQQPHGRFALRARNGAAAAAAAMLAG